MDSQPTLTLNDGRVMPQLGLGVWQTPDSLAAPVVGAALEAGYRLVDTAAIYGNEAGVGRGLRSTGITARSLFVTTKLWNDSHGTEAPVAALDHSLSRLGLPAVDLYLIHWPTPARARYVETWRALIALRETGKARSIGVSNFTTPQLAQLIEETGVVPAVNQIELHPRFQQRELRAFHEEHGIVTQSWSPLGQGKLLDHPVLVEIARKHERTAAQIVIRWHLDLGLGVIPKSATPHRIRENIAVFDFRLDEADKARIAGLDDPRGRLGPHPDDFN
ncbi:aldo/keto reductase [Nitrospirillum viridazoti]|uniref:Oxidoreductase n=1 Tax=Nitrospirillum viridazoti CBAmc TaxID=1441467 RepID=A0A248JQ99_9PROT|nr:aldo/keto reductase [Nitrospirillum amazonense]ASG20933.1 oxidoreductase [Nitrospirillum amazonense CBAmc]TWB37719.1 2,5-diketo-D-gluconate reductase A [Nitrospirillum amazonense]